MTGRARDAGVSLLELTAVLAIFSVVAIMAVQLIAAGLQNREHLAAGTDAAADIAALDAVLRRDIGGVVPLAGPDQPRFGPGDMAFVSAVAGADRDGGLPRLIRVNWRYDAARGEVWRTAAPLDAPRPEQTALLLDGVTGWAARVLTGAGAWVDAQDWRATGPGDRPRALDIRLATRDLADLRLLVAF